MAIRSIPLASRPNQVVDQLADSISKGEFAEGELLPAERELAQRFGVSRNAVREAVTTLKARGLVEVRQGKGTSVSRRISEPVSQAVCDSLAGQDNAESKLLEVRRIVEVAAVRLASVRANTADLEAIGEVVRDFERHLANLDRCAELDVAFHRLIVKAAHNEILSLMLESLTGLLLTRRKLALRRSGADLALAHHHRILDALKKRDPDAAGAEMGMHLDSTRRLMQDTRP